VEATAAIGETSGLGIPAGWPFGPLFRLLILTAARREEIGALRWSEIVGDEIRLTGARTKNGEPHVIPLSTTAIELLRSLHRVGDSDFVFTTTGKTQVAGWSKAKGHLDQAAAEINKNPLPPWRLHDLRRTVATGLQRLGVGLQVVESVLGHVAGSRAGIVGVYQRHSFDVEKRAALEAWASEVDRIVIGKPTLTVVPIASRWA
jgi:integrase